MTILGCAAIAAIALAAGCGGEDAPPTMKEDFIASVDRLCTADDRRTEKAAPEFQAATKADDFDAAADIVISLQTAEAATIDQIEDLNPPEADQFTIDEYVRLSRQINDLDTGIAAAIRAGDKEAADAATEESEKLEDQRDRVADEYGFKVCGSGAGTG